MAKLETKQKEEGIDKCNIIIPPLEKEYTYTKIIEYDPRYCSDNVTVNIKIKLGREAKQVERDVKKLSKVLKRMTARGWKFVKEEKE